MDKSGMAPNRILYESPAITVGRFACLPDAVEFRGPQRIPISQVIFPGRPVKVRRECGRRYLVDSTMAAIYHRGEEYERERIGDFEDRHYWIGFRQCLPGFEHRRTSQAFVWRAGHFREQQRFFHWLESDGAPDALEIEARAVTLADGVLATAATGDHARHQYGTVDRDLIEAVKAQISAFPAQRVTLSGLAREFEVSPFSLFRAFRALTGWTMHSYATEMRLRLAWSLLHEMDDSITDIALDTGFSSHSHFTASFRRRFGMPPSRHPARG